MIAALYVDPHGVYAGLPDVDVWDEARDARLYDGPWPVVAHPPCNKWAKLGPTIGRGDDGGCFEAALHAVRTFGGVLEHPAESRAWGTFGLQRPESYWTRPLFGEAGWVIALDQSAYGFPTRKPTWLYYVGDDPSSIRVGPRLERGCETLWSTERSKTPIAFRDALLALARSASRVAA